MDDAPYRHPGWPPPEHDRSAAGWQPDPRWPPPPEFRSYQHPAGAQAHPQGRRSRFAALVVLALVLTNSLAAVAQSVNEQALPQSLWVAANVIGLVAASLSGVLDLRSTGRSPATLASGPRPGSLGNGSGVSGAWLAASAVFGLVTLFVPFAAPLALFGVLMAFKRRRAAAGAALATLSIGAGAVFLLLLTYTYA